MQLLWLPLDSIETAIIRFHSKLSLFANYALEAINKELLLFSQDNAETDFDDDNQRELTVFAQEFD